MSQETNNTNTPIFPRQVGPCQLSKAKKMQAVLISVKEAGLNFYSLKNFSHIRSQIKFSYSFHVYDNNIQTEHPTRIKCQIDHYVGASQICLLVRVIWVDIVKEKEKNGVKCEQTRRQKVKSKKLGSSNEEERERGSSQLKCFNRSRQREAYSPRRNRSAAFRSEPPLTVMGPTALSTRTPFADHHL